MAVKLANLGYKAGMPGMIASTGYKHTRQQVEDSVWINKTADKEFPYGTVICADPLTGNLCLPNVANAKFVGILQDPAREVGKVAYAPKDQVIVCTMGDIWTKIDPAINIKQLTDPVYYIITAGTTLGYVTNVPGASNLLIPNARFTTSNANGVVVVSLAFP